MNREQRRSYTKLHCKDRRVIACDICGIKTANRIEQEYKDGVEYLNHRCEVCGNIKSTLMSIKPDSYTTRSTTERTAY